MRAPFDPSGRMLQLKILLVQLISAAATPVSVRVRLCQFTPDRFVKCSVSWIAVESTKVKVSAFTAVQEYALPQKGAAFTTRGAPVVFALATWVKFTPLAWSNTDEKSTELA